jgi:hypothetical protein
MKTHKFDPVSFVFGAAFVALSVILTSGHATLAAVRAKWLGGAFLLALGVAMLLTSGRRA